MDRAVSSTVFLLGCLCTWKSNSLPQAGGASRSSISQILPGSRPLLYEDGESTIRKKVMDAPKGLKNTTARIDGALAIDAENQNAHGRKTKVERLGYRVQELKLDR
jgi:hypothetical protein